MGRKPTDPRSIDEYALTKNAVEANRLNAHTGETRMVLEGPAEWAILAGFVGPRWVLRAAATLGGRSTKGAAPGGLAEALGALADLLDEEALGALTGSPARLDRPAPATVTEAVERIELASGVELAASGWMGVVESIDAHPELLGSGRADRLAARLGLHFATGNEPVAWRTPVWWLCPVDETLYPMSPRARLGRGGACPTCAAQAAEASAEAVAQRCEATRQMWEAEQAGLPLAEQDLDQYVGRERARETAGGFSETVALPANHPVRRGLLGTVTAAARHLDSQASIDGSAVELWYDRPDPARPGARKEEMVRAVLEHLAPGARITWRESAGLDGERSLLVGWCGWTDHAGWVMPPASAMRAADQHGHACPACAEDGRAMLASEGRLAALAGDARAAEWTGAEQNAAVVTARAGEPEPARA